MGIGFKEIKIPAFFLSIVWIPVFFAQRYYMDDLGRSVRGYYEWNPNGRPLTEAIFWVFYQGGGVFDVSPLFQILSIPVMALSCVILLKSIGFKVGRFELLASSLIFITPLYLENMAYRYDSLSMALSCMMVICSFWLSLDIKNYKQYILGIAIGVAFLSTYQAFISVYLVLIISAAIRSEGVIDSVKKSLPPAICLLISYAIYSKIIAPNFVTGDYNKIHSEISIDIKTFIYNSKLLTTFLLKYLHSIQGAILIGFISLSSAFYLYLSASLGIKVFVWRLILITLLIVCPFIAFIPLASPVYNPRVFVGLGSVLSVVILLCSQVKSFRFSAAPLIYIYLLFMSSLSFTYANASNQMQMLESASINTINNEISMHPGKTVAVFGEILKQGALANMSKSNPMIDYMTPVYLKNDSWWGKLQLNQYGMNRDFLTDKNERFSVLNSLCKNKTTSQGFYDTEKYIVVVLSPLRC